MRAAAEGEHGPWAVAGDVEAVGVVVDVGVAVGGGGVGQDDRAGRDDDPAEFDVFCGHADAGEDDRGVAHGLLHGVGCQFGMFGQQRPLVGMIAEDLHGGAQLIAGGVGSGAEQRGGEHEQFVVGQAVTVVLGANQVGKQVVGQPVPAPSAGAAGCDGHV